MIGGVFAVPKFLGARGNFDFSQERIKNSLQLADAPLAQNE
jgi:hypothetical protein